MLEAGEHELKLYVRDPNPERWANLGELSIVPVE